MLVACPAPSHYLQSSLTVSCTLGNQLQWNWNRNKDLFIHQNSLESDVCKMAAILSRGRWVKKTFLSWNRAQVGNLKTSVTIVCWMTCLLMMTWDPLLPTQINTLRPRQNGRHFPDDNFKCIFVNENVSISIKISLKFVPKGQINNIPALVQIMAWRRPGAKPLSEPMMVSLPTHICVARPEWVKVNPSSNCIYYKVWGEITYAIPNFSSVTVEVWKWISSFIPHFAGHEIT